MPEPIPAHLEHLPTWHGLPVPDVAAWSSEARIVVRYDPIAGRVATFNDGRQGRGRPVFGVMNPGRQRRAVLAAVCQICGRCLNDIPVKIEDGIVCATSSGWLPNHPKLVEMTDDKGGRYLLEPPCCEPCARWAAIGCPGIRGTVTDLIEVLEIEPLAQLLDLTEFAGRHAGRFDKQETPESVARLARISAKHPGGIMGYARYRLVKTEKHDL